MLICIEGLTNSGKTTLCRSLVNQVKAVYINDFLRNDVVASNITKITHPIENLDKFNEKTELLLYLSKLSQKAYWIDFFKKKDGLLIVDRFSLSVFAQFCDNIPGVDKRFLYEIVKFSSNYIIPDYTFFLDVKLEVIIQRTTTSPFSRKDLLLSQKYINMRNSYIKNMEEFSKSCSIINCGNGETVEELSNTIIGMIRKGLL